jgi:hypothetical protein
VPALELPLPAPLLPLLPPLPLVLPLPLLPLVLPPLLPLVEPADDPPVACGVTVTVNCVCPLAQLMTLPTESCLITLALHVTVVVPTGYVIPLRWSHETVSDWPPTSVAVTSAQVATAPAELVAGTLIGAGALNDGPGTVTVTVNVTELRNPAGSAT